MLICVLHCIWQWPLRWCISASVACSSSIPPKSFWCDFSKFGFSFISWNIWKMCKLWKSKKSFIIWKMFFFEILYFVLFSKFENFWNFVLGNLIFFEIIWYVSFWVGKCWTCSKNFGSETTRRLWSVSCALWTLKIHQTNKKRTTPLIRPLQKP